MTIEQDRRQRGQSVQNDGRREQWTLGDGPGRTIINAPVLKEAKEQSQKVEALMQTPGYKKLIEANPSLALQNLYNSTSFVAGDGKTYNIKAILDGTQPAHGQGALHRARAEAVADATAIMLTKIYNLMEADAKLSITDFSSNPTALRGTTKNNWNGELRDYLQSSENAKKLGLKYVEGLCRGQAIQIMDLTDPKLTPPKTRPRPFERTPRTHVPGVATPTIDTVTTSETARGGDQPESSVGTQTWERTQRPHTRSGFPIPLPGFEGSFGGFCKDLCDGLIRVSS